MLSVAERIRTIEQLREEGLDRNGIAERLGAEKTQIRNFCNRHNVLVRGPRDDDAEATPWKTMGNEERAEVVERMVAEGKTKQEISRELGMTMNALHGFVWRKKIRGASSTRIRFFVPPPDAFVDGDPIDPTAWSAIAGEPVDFLDNRGCAWPIDTPEGQKCCGGAVHRHSYCETHHAMAYRKPRVTELREPAEPTRRSVNYVYLGSKKPVRRNDYE